MQLRHDKALVNRCLYYLSPVIALFGFCLGILDVQTKKPLPEKENKCWHHFKPLSIISHTRYVFSVGITREAKKKRRFKLLQERHYHGAAVAHSYARLRETLDFLPRLSAVHNIISTNKQNSMPLSVFSYLLPQLALVTKRVGDSINSQCCTMRHARPKEPLFFTLVETLQVYKKLLLMRKVVPTEASASSSVHHLIMDFASTLFPKIVYLASRSPKIDIMRPLRSYATSAARHWLASRELAPDTLLPHVDPGVLHGLCWVSK